MSVTLPYAQLDEERYTIRSGDCVQVMAQLPSESVDVVFADPPYFLSGGGSTNRGGKRTSVNKGDWDSPKTPEAQLLWTQRWLMEAKRILKSTGTVWVCGTMHSVHSAGYALQLLQMSLLNEIAWVKPNPPPNLGCRCFTHSHETLLWASKGKRVKHVFDYPTMKLANGGKQMKDVWHFQAPRKVEHKKHPTEKPSSLVARALMASMPQEGIVVDPFGGSHTTGVAVASCMNVSHAEENPAWGPRDWSYIGIEIDDEWNDVGCERIQRELDVSAA